ncbi:hypothetical protein CERSUDRAFT_117640 [Gelatoporia subvermispora B]|uniref:dolichol kinase n=1 Tax=Ceriporiopsis subvermispora (strain B) TaxID=914234 RepID=M2R5G1_CERS8|nr:hypothetical protein CERSUDRAFT_117640 [Gelatoporia subvermispora B]
MTTSLPFPHKVVHAASLTLLSPSGRADLPRRAQASARRHAAPSGSTPGVSSGPGHKLQQQGWSTSYQAGSSSSDLDCSTSDEDTDTGRGARHPRGRRGSQHALGNGARDVGMFAKGPHEPSSASGGSRRSSPTRIHERKQFTRSRSPAIRSPLDSVINGQELPGRTGSPSLFPRHKHTNPAPSKFLLSSGLHVTVRLPWTPAPTRCTLDIRQATENALLICSLGYAAVKLRTCAREPLSPDMWISIELSLLIVAALIYFLWTRLVWTSLPTPPDTSNRTPHPPARPGSPRLPDNRDARRATAAIAGGSARSGEAGFLWMTVPKNYRDCADDGILTGLLVGPLIAAAMHYQTLQTATSAPPTRLLPSNWLIEPPALLPLSAYSALDSLLLSRRHAVDLSTFCATILLVHVCASWATEARHRKNIRVPDGEVNSVPRKEGRRTYLYVLFTVSVTLWILCVRIALGELKLGIWQNMSYFEVVMSSLFYQFTLYIAIRLAHHGFTLGELGLVCFGATVLFSELLNITIARIWPITTPFIKTYRLPTPLLLYQIALIPGSLLTGFLLSPLLYLSRHIARRPVRRLRYPAEKLKHRRLLAAGFYAGALAIVAGLIGGWLRWCLGGRDPWMWVMRWLLAGRRPWTRCALLAYWALLVSLSVAGWSRQLARSRRYRHRAGVGSGSEHYSSFDAGRGAALASAGAAYSTGSAPVQAAAPTNAAELGDSSTPSTPAWDASGPLGLSFAGIPNLPNLSNLPNLPNSAQVSTVATDLLDAADKHVPTLSLNARRKFFHALAVVMFLPGMVVDPAFMHLSFSASFALFTFAEYVRYFALYPFGATVHLFMYEFLDNKDSGTAILSHFYLLTGCANTLWFEGPSRLLEFTGILVLGIGDALASIVGKRWGRHRWIPTSPKTLEGSAAFVCSIVACAWLLRVCGYTENFSVVRYTVVAVLSGALEAFSVQNDNLTLPLYMWSMLVLADV